ncbi:MAG: hypothetical protein HY257_01715 [Chloroflexi bacterium]|nr:hypothetical protein [Chloroflexota bacterium]
MLPQDFSTRTHFPGTYTSRFDFLLHFAEAVQNLRSPIFAAILFLIALLSTRDLFWAFSFWIFVLFDWLVIALLPRARKSFGPSKPPTLILAILRAPFAALPYPYNFFAQTLGTALMIYAFWIEPHKISVTRATLRTTKLDARAPPLRVLHLGDLHVERITARERELIRRAHDLAPDLILFSGDFLNLSNLNDPAAWEDTRAIFRALSAPLGIYAVTGSPPVDQPEIVARLLNGLDVRWLRDKRVTVQHYGCAIDVIGITCTHRPQIDRETLRGILRGAAKNFSMLVYHSPDLAPEAAAQGIDLQLSGHTHGGQIRLPIFGALYTSSLYGKQFEMGQYQIDELTLYVTRGIGLEGAGAPRARFLCPPEIILWEISGAVEN